MAVLTVTLNAEQIDRLDDVRESWQCSGHRGHAAGKTITLSVHPAEDAAEPSVRITAEALDVAAVRRINWWTCLRRTGGTTLTIEGDAGLIEQIRRGWSGENIDGSV